MFICLTSGGLDYSSGSSLVSPAQSSMFPVHPDVRLKHLPFYDVVAELMKPTSLGIYRYYNEIVSLLGCHLFLLC